MAFTEKEKLFRRVARMVIDLDQLDRDLQRAGERELGDAAKRARREFELIDRGGVFLRRGVDDAASL